MCYYTKLQSKNSRDEFKAHISPYIMSTTSKVHIIFAAAAAADDDDDDDDDGGGGDDLDMFTREVIR